MFFFGLGEKLKVLSKKYSEYKYGRFCEMAEFLQVSKTALAYRLEQFGLLERNYLIQEAQQRKGVASQNTGLLYSMVSNTIEHVSKMPMESELRFTAKHQKNYMRKSLMPNSKSRNVRDGY